MAAGNVIFTLALAAALGFFVRRVYLLFAMVLLGQGENRFDRLHERLKALFLYGFGQRRVVERPFGVNHFLLFWGFILLQFAVNIEFILNGVFPAFSLRFIGDAAYRALGVSADVTSFVVLFVVVAAIVRRAFFRPRHMESKAGAYLILVLVGLLMIANFGVHVASLSMGEAGSRHLPVSRLLSAAFVRSGRLPWPVLREVSWWLHGIVLLIFICYIPYSKHVHILTALLNCFFRRLSFPATLARLAFRRGGTFGVSRMTQLTWKDLYDFLSCTECARCAEACPATGTGKALNPMEVILEGKANMETCGMAILRARSFDSFERADERASVPVPLIGEGEKEQVRPEAIWDCTTCGACVEACPVFIEQFPKLLKMRRHLVMEKVEFPEELVAAFENIEQRSNPYGVAPAERGRWAEGMDIPLASPRESTEYLLFAGCVPSFNGRMRGVLASVVKILRTAGISFAMLGSKEPCCGDPLRRTGNEYVFDRIARANIERFREYGVKRIITLCAHCYNSLKNDYPAFGADFEVFHHTELIARHLPTMTPVIVRAPFDDARIVIHDACYLGRYNGIYEAPRQIVRAVTRSGPVEMEKNRRRSFCCGAGGGRLWMHESRGIRISTARTRQALAERPSIVATSCPYCLIMFEDGLKDEGAYGRVRAMDVSELLAETLAPARAPQGGPALP
ncbi:MAG: (Fe-S)-binding protein [Syntrophorhabdales bacterium]|jgi:Fe-S oxidoreductase